MTRAVILLVVLALCSHASAISDIVAFGDSLTDDCTFGASALVDSVLDTNLVRLRSENFVVQSCSAYFDRFTRCAGTRC